MRLLFFTFLTLLFSSMLAQDNEVYALLENGTTIQLDLKLKTLSTKKGNQTLAYKGALLAKKASKLKTPQKKLKAFKEGANLLDETIKEEPTNLEFRFLRYIIQAKSPKFLSYNKNRIEDKNRIEKGKVNKVLKELIIDFNHKNEAFKIAIN